MTIDPRSPDRDAIEREWQAQERARTAERQGLDTAATDRHARRYRAIAHALGQPLAEQLPADFARRTASLIDPGVAREAPPETRFERNLTRGLVAAFGLAAGVVIALDGRDWLSAIPLGWLAGTLANPWLLTLAACLGASGLLGLWHPARRAAGHRYSG
jgi:hypothetical protein